MPPNGRPTVAYVVHSLNPGGTEKLVVDMAAAFQGEFHVEVLCLDEPGLWAEELRRKGVPVHCVWRQPGLDLRVSARLAAHFRRMNAALVHAHQYTPWFYAALARLWYRTPKLLFEEHGRFFPEIDNRRRRIVNRCVTSRFTDRIVAVSDDIRERLVRYEGLKKSTIEVIHNGVTPATPIGSRRDVLRASFGFAASDVVVGTVGRFDPIKNLPLLVESLERVMTTAPAVKGLLVGHGPSFAEVDGLVRSRDLAHKIVLPGFRSDARDVVQCLDVFVLASLSEGVSVALLEAMAAGVPAIVTAVGGNPEVVANGQTGWVVPSEDSEALATALREAATDPVVRSAYGIASRQRFDEKFEFRVMVECYRRIYCDLLRSDSRA